MTKGFEWNHLMVNVCIYQATYDEKKTFVTCFTNGTICQKTWKKCSKNRMINVGDVANQKLILCIFGGNAYSRYNELLE